MARKIEVDRDLCMGAGQCCVYASGTFDQDEMGVAIVADPDADAAADIRQAVTFCPTQALSFDEDGSG